MADSQRKTANLFDISSEKTIGGRIAYDCPLTIGQIYTFTNCSDYVLGFKISVAATSYNSVIKVPLQPNESYTFTMERNPNIPEGSTQYFFIIIDSVYGVEINEGDVMLNAGSTPLPYEPYGWQHSLRKLGTSTDTLTTLPADVYADGNNATVGLVGNMSQTGIPTPSSPIQPQECGERTGNLFDKSATDTTNGYVANNYLDSTGNIVASNYYNISEYINISGLNTITVSGMKPAGSSGSVASIGLYDSDKILIISSDYAYGNETSKSFTIPSNAKYIRISYSKNRADTTMLNIGSTALPYEPYGVKIPILSANTTTPVYLGEVQSTRRIKKYEFTGEEDITIANGVMRYIINGYKRTTDWGVLSTHYNGVNNITRLGDLTAEQIAFLVSSSGNNYLYIYDSTYYNDATGFKMFLAAQYAAGTPVTIWYVLETETTGIVNESLRKIGNYADTVSGITIPTITGADTFDVLTTLKPSEVDLTYTGWHDASVKEWDGSEWQ